MAALIGPILIANRGEVACRIIRTARRLGLRTIAVYSEPDANAQHVMLADEARPIGPAPARDSYLAIPRILEAARASGAAAIHPGYGFLSENAAFAEACAAAGLVFIGPPPAAIRAMGSKSAAKDLMEKARVPLIPGYHGADQDTTRLAAEAERIGYPVLIKPSEGGGGKGMKIVENAAAFAEALGSARREAEAAFGDGRVLLERYLTRPRHIEVQIFGDAFGAIVHLGTRDCSIQRRHQKVIEEAPAPCLSDAMRARLHESAVAAARAVGYVGAGTVEFIAEGDDFYFMEMNTRLQVEHPVTEAVTGLDLVEWQIRIASGERLPLTQDEIRFAGHALEARLYAEDPQRDFLPQSGRLLHVGLPAGEGVRVDSGIATGDMVGIHYDPLLAKLIASGLDRATALQRLAAGLDGCEIVGVTTNLALLRAIARHPSFAAGEIDTGFIARHADALLAPVPVPTDLVGVMAGLAMFLRARQAARAAAACGADPWSPWALATGWRLAGEARQELSLTVNGSAMALAIGFRGDGFVFALEGTRHDAEGALAADGAIEARIDGVRRTARLVTGEGETLFLLVDGTAYTVMRRDAARAAGGPAAGSGRITAPMPGRIAQLCVAEGAEVGKQSVLLVLEAMKMEHALRAPYDGTVVRVACGLGDLVEEGALLLELGVPGALAS
jgi:3-methylcrotonyl-CoA carboxylase alpha subunit